MASLSSSATTIAEAVSASASASGIAAALDKSQYGFRAPSSDFMGSVPRFFSRMASLGFLGTDSPSTVTSSVTEAVATDAIADAAAVSGGNAAAASTASGNITDLPSGGSFDSGMRSMGGVFNYATSKWALLCLFMVDFFLTIAVFRYPSRIMSIDWL